MVVALAGVAPQTVPESLRFDDIAVILPPAAVDFPMMSGTVAVHGTEILQWSGFPQLVYQLGQFVFEFGAVQYLVTSRPPCMPEFLPTAAEVDADMTDGAQLRILFFREGEKKTRLIGRGRPQCKFALIGGEGDAVILAEIRKSQGFTEEIKLAPQSAEPLLGECDWLRR